MTGGRVSVIFLAAHTTSLCISIGLSTFLWLQHFSSLKRFEAQGDIKHLHKCTYIYLYLYFFKVNMDEIHITYTSCFKVLFRFLKVSKKR